MRNETLTFVVVLILTVALGAPGLAGPKPLSGVRLAWTPTTSPSQYGSINLTAMSGVKMEIRDLADKREKPELIGENREEEEKGIVLPVIAADKPALFITQNLKHLFSDAGLKVADSGGDVIVSGEVKRFFVQETSIYQGEASLALEVKNREGKVLWSGAAGGTAKRFGRSYKAENYIKVLCDSLMDAAYTLLQDDTFLRALSGK